MELRQLEQFKTAAELESLSRAAEKLYVSQPSLSISIRKLEEELGVELFSRTKNHVYLNPAGRMALKYTNEVFNDIKAMKNALYEYSQQSREIYIGSSAPPANRYYLPLFIKENPEVLINTRTLSQDEILKRVLGRDIDLAISVKPIVHNDIVTKSFATEQLLLCVPPSSKFADRDEIDIRELDGEPLLASRIEDGGYITRNLLDYAKIHQIELKFLHQADYLVYLELSRTSNYSHLTSNISKHFLTLGDRKLIPVTNPELTIDYYIVYRKDMEYKVASIVDWIENNPKVFED